MIVAINKIDKENGSRKVKNDLAANDVVPEIGVYTIFVPISALIYESW